MTSSTQPGRFLCSCQWFWFSLVVSVALLTNFNACCNLSHVGLTPMIVQRNEIESQAPFDLVSWSRVPTDWWLWAPVTLREYKMRKGVEGTDDEVGCDLTLSPTSPSGPITKAQRQRESSTQLRVSGSHRIQCCSSSLSQRPTNLLPLHRQVSLRRLQRCRVYRTSPLVRRANPKALSVVPLLTFGPTRCRPSRSLSTNTSVILTLVSEIGLVF
jgi:hypothetical protein